MQRINNRSADKSQTLLVTIDEDDGIPANDNGYKAYQIMMTVIITSKNKMTK